MPAAENVCAHLARSTARTTRGGVIFLRKETGAAAREIESQNRDTAEKKQTLATRRAFRDTPSHGAPTGDCCPRKEAAAVCFVTGYSEEKP
jgi:hypothetical protein